jgi:riboflavin kinase/FMN adenylyltransferase
MSIVVIGNFDGVHRGHQQILNRAKALARDEKIVALTFDPHPTSVCSRACTYLAHNFE